MTPSVFEEAPPVPVTLAVTALRAVTGVILLAHAWQKLNEMGAWRAELAQLGAPSPEIAAPLCVAAGLFLGAGLVLGWLTRISAFGMLAATVAAIVMLHAHNGLFARDGGFEYPLALAAMSLLLLTMGGGRLSADRFLSERARLRAIRMDERWQHPPYVSGPTKAFLGE